MYELLKERKPPVKPEAYEGQHPEDGHHVLSGGISRDGTFNKSSIGLVGVVSGSVTVSELYPAEKSEG